MSDDVVESGASEEISEVDSAPVDAGVESQSMDAGVGQAAAQAQQEQANHYAAFRTLPQFRGLDDQQIAARLYETMQREQSQSRALQQYQQLIPVASDYLANKDAFLKWREAQQSPQQAPQQAQAPQPQQNWWNPPQVKESYRNYLTRDAEGREVISEHAPLEAKAALTEWMNYRADFARKFLDNPEQALGPMVERVAEQRAAELVDRQMNRARQEQFVKSVEDENREWLYSDQENRVASREGVLVQKYIEDVKAMGVTDPEQRWNTAVAFLERDLALQVLQQMVDQQQAPQAPAAHAASAPVQSPASPAADQAQKNMEFLRKQASRTATRNSPATTDPRVPKRPLTFAERLKSDLQSAGIAGLE